MPLEVGAQVHAEKARVGRGAGVRIKDPLVEGKGADGSVSDGGVLGGRLDRE